MKLKEINQKVVAKEERLKDIEIGSDNTDKKGHTTISKENSTNKYGENARRHTNDQITRKQL